jgi:hypothetical protein
MGASEIRHGEVITAQTTDIGADPMHIGMTACTR